MSDDSLGTKLGDALRNSASDQATSYTRYAALLERFAKKEVDVMDFGRESLDIYADAVRDVTQIGGRMAKDVVKTGVDRIKGIRFTAKAEADTGEGGAVVVGAATRPRPKPNG